MSTPQDAIPLLAPGAQVVVRDEEWLIRSVQQTREDGLLVRVIGTSELVRDQEASFFTELDDIQPLRPEDTKLVEDHTPGFRRSRLFLEALLRKTPLPVGDSRLAVGHRQLLHDLDYQKRPVKLALDALRPRLLIADAVGLGKTLEVGMLLSELIRRGRGERILVVTPRHILEQFQHELWTRFAIPLVRLDSEGIQRVRQKIPATRNPFTFYKRIIISIDTLKSPGRYRHHLEGIRWDAVVIDECHSLINRGTLNNALARVLAPRTEALMLTSATPHNGKAESFAELVRLLDPTAIANPKDYERKDIDHLYVRRHKASSEVSAEVGSHWADRKDPKPILARASDPEQAVFDELADVWLYPREERAPVSGAGRRLFPWTLLKAFLSSHRALAETVENRRKTLAQGDGSPPGSDRGIEDEALERLADLCDQIDDDSSAKLAAITETLTNIGVGPDSGTRAVVFSERHATLNWLADTLPDVLGLEPEQVLVLHGGLADVTQQDIVEEFALAGSPVRLLLTGDIASEGVNLHRQCHHLIHFDLPWSLITIEQRNGRIDRYGQEHSPEIRAVLLAPDREDVRGDIDVLGRLLGKENQAHRALGDAASLMGLHSEKEEEEEIMRALADGRDIDEVVPDKPAHEFDLLMAIAGEGADEPAATQDPPSLFPTVEAFVEEALRESYDDPVSDLDLRRETEHSIISFLPPDDLLRRLDVLPQSYLSEQKVTERLRLTVDQDVADHSLHLARDRAGSGSLWPDVMFLSGQHPVVEWLVDKVLVKLGRNEAPVLVAGVSEPVFLIQGVYSNKRGQPTVIEWMAVDRLPDHASVRPLDEVLEQAGVHGGMSNPGVSPDLSDLQALVPTAVEAAEEHLQEVREERSEALNERIRDHSERLRGWREDAEQLAMEMGNIPQRKHREKEIESISADTEALINALGTTGQPLVRVVAVLVGER